MAFLEHMFVNSGTMEFEHNSSLLPYCLSQCEVDSTYHCSKECFTECFTKVKMEGAENCWATTWESLEEDGKLSQGAYGFIQLLGLMSGYGYMLMNAATLIGEGAELLLLVPSMATLVGTLVLPVLGAVPDGAIVFFSGLGPTAQEDLAVGMGALAGSTIMLLTIPWFLSIYAGRVDIVGGQCRYKPPAGEKKLTPGRGASRSGISADVAVTTSCTLMLITCVPYFIIQVRTGLGCLRTILSHLGVIPRTRMMTTEFSRRPDCMLQGPAFFPTHGSISDLHPNNTHHTGDIAHEQGFALFGLIVAAAMFFGCCAWFVMSSGSKESQEAVDMLTVQVQQGALEDGLMNFTGMFLPL